MGVMVAGWAGRCIQVGAGVKRKWRGTLRLGIETQKRGSTSCLQAPDPTVPRPRWSASSARSQGQPLPFDAAAASSYLKAKAAEHGTVNISVSIGGGPGRCAPGHLPRSPPPISQEGLAAAESCFFTPALPHAACCPCLLPLACMSVACACRNPEGIWRDSCRGAVLCLTAGGWPGAVT